MGTDILQLILIGNVFLLGILVAVIIRAIIDHRHPKPQSNFLLDTMKQDLADQAEQEFRSSLESSSALLSNDMDATAKQLSRLLERFGTEILQQEMKLFRENLDTIRQKTANEFGLSQRELDSRQSQLEIELARRRSELEQRIQERQNDLELRLMDVQTSIEQGIINRQKDFDKALSDRQHQLDADLDNQLAKERAHLLAQLDTKLGDAVTSFLTESLGTKVDLGAQTPYLLELLEQHKAEFKQHIAHKDGS